MLLLDDALPQVNASHTRDRFVEDVGDYAWIYSNIAKFYVSRTGATTKALTVYYTLGGTAIAGVDYTAPSGSVVIPAAAAGAYVNVAILADKLAEGTETIVLNITPDATYSPGIASATRYIEDAQVASVATQVRFSAATSTAAENAGTVNIPVTLSAAAATPVTVEYFINGGTALGAGLDYRLTAGVLTFAPGETSKNIPVVIIDDTLAENSETLIIALGNPNNARLGTNNPHVLTITDNDSQVGQTYTVSTSASPAAGGTTSGGGTFNSGSSVTVTATANAGYSFVNWTEGANAVSTSASYAFTLSANRTLVANFTAIPYTVVTSSAPAAGGTTSGGGTFNSGSSVTVTATANTGYAFVNWTEGANAVSTSASYTFTLSANRTLVANFTAIPYTVVTSSAPAAGGTTSGGGTFNSGSSVTVTATANSNYAFVNWTEGANAVSTSASYTFTISANRTLVANFGPALPPPWVQSYIGTPFGLHWDDVANTWSNQPAVGSGSYAGGVYTVAGTGRIGSKADAFRFVYQTLSADGQIVARIRSFQNTGSSARVGVMIRDTLAPGSREAFLGVEGSGSFRSCGRITTDGNASTKNNIATGTAPNVWVKITRVGSTFTAYRSTNGTTWTLIGSDTITMATNCYIGLAVASGSGALNTSTFDNVEVTP